MFPMIPKILLALFVSLHVVSAQWKPVEGRIMTKWGTALDPQKVWSEYPRPQLERENWTNLNGLWSYAISPQADAKPAEWAGEILVPFAPEAALSGVGKTIEPGQALWYRRSFSAEKPQAKRVIIHFEAVDYESTVWINGTELGKHTGGFTPFSYDITAALKDGENELTVRVLDATGDYQLVGKQHLKPHGIWYTRVTGIWQSVWLEQVNARAIEDLDFVCDIRDGSVGIRTKLAGPAVAGEKLRVTASIGGQPAGSASGSGNLTLKLSTPQLWSPETPHLYDLKVELLDGSGQVIDTVKSYTALREVGKARDANGNWRFTLNGKPIFHWGPLDQGWWPDGLLTPPSDAAMLSDIHYLKDAGFNMIRKHIKVEPRRYYYHCDRLGMLMWQDQVSMGYGPDSLPKNSNPPWTRLAPNPREGTWPDAAHQQFVLEYKRMVDHLRDHPCIVVWSPFNEAWGQHRTMEVGKMAVDYDKTRHINIASGGNFWPVGDIADEHAYPDPTFPLDDKRFDPFIKVVGEFGGHGWPVKGHLWDAGKENWGYGGLPQSLDEWKRRYTKSIDVLCGLRRRGIAAGVYTQTTDVEGEINGLLTYDRIAKADPAWLKERHQKLMTTPDAATYSTIMESCEKQAHVWSYTFNAPADGWHESDFNASGWESGKGGFGTPITPKSKVGTTWTSNEIWMRREFQLTSRPKGRPVLRIFHDEEVTVFLNGTQIASLSGFLTDYSTVVLDGEAPLKPGRNVIAVHCRNTEGGQFIDVGISDEFVPADPVEARR